jgi:hypothetical protein
MCIEYETGQTQIISVTKKKLPDTASNTSFHTYPNSIELRRFHEEIWNWVANKHFLIVY